MVVNSFLFRNTKCDAYIYLSSAMPCSEVEPITSSLLTQDRTRSAEMPPQSPVTRGRLSSSSALRRIQQPCRHRRCHSFRHPTMMMSSTRSSTRSTSNHPTTRSPPNHPKTTMKLLRWDCLQGTCTSACSSAFSFRRRRLPCKKWIGSLLVQKQA